MKAKLAAIAVASLFAANASAALYCKNDHGQTIFWQAGDPLPMANYSLSGEHRLGFDMSRDLVCFVNSYALTYILGNFRGIPYQVGIPSTGLDGPGLIYRGDWARFLIENLPSGNGQYIPKTIYDAAQP